MDEYINQLTIELETGERDIEKKNEITITVSLNGSDVYREYVTSNLDVFEDADTLGLQVIAMLETLRNEDKV